VGFWLEVIGMGVGGKWGVGQEGVGGVLGGGL
jgi:hypothetical protein